jgi:signal transduction histidine kinase
MPGHPEWLAPGTTAYALWLDLAVVSVLIVIASLAYRSRQAASSTQQGQMMWVLAALGLASPVVLLSVPLPFVNTSLVPIAAVSGEPFVVLVVGLFLAVSSITCGLVALLNYEPLDADVLVNRAIVYVALTAFVIGTYVLIVGYLSTVFHSDNVLLSLIASGLIATFLQPVRARLQRAVNRLTYGERDEPYRVLARLGQRLEVAVEPASALPLTVETIARALKLPYVAIVLERDGFLQIVAAHGAAQEEVAHFPLVHAGQAIGELVAGTRASNETLTPADQRLLQDLARQTSVAAHAALLTTNLEQARVRLVTERGEARRQLGSDLHDGVGHQLVGLTRQVERAMTSADDPGVARSLLTEINHRLVDLTKQVRGLAHRLYPPELESLGLTGALRERAAEHSNLRIYVDAPDALPRLPAEIEMAAYYITLEALTNVDKHAAANACQVQLRLAQDRAVLGTAILKLDIRDNGQGMPIKTREGLGLLSMRARAAEVGGTCRIEPNHGGGTAVIVRIPCPIKLE